MAEAASCGAGSNARSGAAPPRRRPLPRPRALLLACLAVALLSAGLRGDPTAERFHRLAAQLRCTCGCQQSLLNECNNMQCSARASLDAALNKLGKESRSGESDSLILQDFVQEFGPAVLAEPPRQGFSLVVWIAPWVAAGLGLVGIFAAFQYWRRRRAALGEGTSGFVGGSASGSAGGPAGGLSAGDGPGAGAAADAQLSAVRAEIQAELDREWGQTPRAGGERSGSRTRR